MQSLNATQEMQSLSATPIGGWQTFYATLLDKGQIPNAASSMIDADNAVFRGAYLVLDDIQRQIAAGMAAPAITTVYADILTLTKPIKWNLSESALVIYARRIEIQSGAGLTVVFDLSQEGQQAASLALFAGWVDGTISVAVAGAADHAGLPGITGTAAAPGVAVDADGNGGLHARPLAFGDGFPVSMSDDQESYLYNSFILGALASDSYPSIAIDIMVWINNWARATTSINASDLGQLIFQSSSLASLLQAQIVAADNGATYVPYLSSGVYAKLATSMGAALLAQEQNYVTIFSASTISDELIATTQTMQKSYGNQLANLNNLLAQAKIDYVDAIKAAQTATSHFRVQQIVTMAAGNNLTNIGIPDYTEQKKIEAAIAVISGIVNFAGGIAEMSLGDETSAPAVVQSAMEMVKAAKGAEETAKVMGQLKALIQLLAKLYNLAQDLYAASQLLPANPGGPVNPDTRPVNIALGDAINGVATWSAYQIQSDSNMQPLCDLGIQYASDYKVAIDTLTVYGQALSAAQLAVIKASQSVVQLTTQVSYAAQDSANIAALIQQLKNKQGSLLKIQQRFYQKYLNDKLSLYTILKSYQATYFYWALAPLSSAPTLMDLGDITDSLDAMVNLSLDKYRGLINFGGGPQFMKSQTAIIEDPQVIAALRANRSAQWVVGLDNSSFAGLDRVRVNRIRVWLVGEGVYPAPASTVAITITTSGNYYDRFQGQQFQFNTRPLAKLFEYKVNDKTVVNPDFIFPGNLPASVVIDGAAGPGAETGNDYFEPTPFSEWSISVDTASTQLDFTKISAVVMEFQGTVIPSMHRAGS